MLIIAKIRNLQVCELTVTFTATESDSISPANCDAENCGRVKRRRMLHFSGTGEECVPASSPAFESGAANDPPFVVHLLFRYSSQLSIGVYFGSCSVERV